MLINVVFDQLKVNLILDLDRFADWVLMVLLVFWGSFWGFLDCFIFLLYYRSSHLFFISTSTDL